MMLFCGVDIGTTNLKIALVDDTSAVLWTRVIPTPRASDGIGEATDPCQLLEVVEDGIITGCSAVGRGRALSAISTTGVGEDGVCLDRALRPLGAAIPWFDRRAEAEADFIANSSASTPRAGIRMDPTRSGAKWLWMRKRQPEMVAAAKCWAALTDFPLIFWSGRPFMSETLASRTGCFDFAARRWLPELLALCEAPPLPETLRGGAVIGTVSGDRLLSAGVATQSTLLVAGGHDHPVAASAIQQISPLARVDSLGTANVLYGETQSVVADHFNPDVCFVPPVRSQQGVGCLGALEFSHAVRPLEAELRAVLALPAIPGEPYRGGLLHPESDRLLWVRRLLETVGFRARSIFEAMDGVGVPPAPIFATGGWSRSDALLALRASIYGASVTALSELELAVVGAALLAAEASGASVQFSPTTRTIDPVGAWSEAYQEIYREYPRSRGAVQIAAKG